MTDTETRLRTLVADQLCVDPAAITAGSKFGDDLRADSLDTVELSMLAEEEFGIDIDDDEALDAFDVGSTFAKACALVERKRVGAGS